jgi:hypothetical protein
MVWYSLQWRQDADGIWHGPAETQVAIFHIAGKVKTPDLVFRIQRFLHINQGSKALKGPRGEFCARTSHKQVFVCGFSESNWVTIQSSSADWETVLATLPTSVLSHRFLPVSSYREIKSNNSRIRLLDGMELNLPTKWYWLDEELGMPPTTVPDTLMSKGERTSIRVLQYASSNSKKVGDTLSRLGFSPHLLESGSETRSRDLDYATCLRTRREWLVFILTKPNQAKKRSLQGLISYIKNRVK